MEVRALCTHCVYVNSFYLEFNFFNFFLFFYILWFNRTHVIQPAPSCGCTCVHVPFFLPGPMVVQRSSQERSAVWTALERSNAKTESPSHLCPPVTPVYTYLWYTHIYVHTVTYIHMYYVVSVLVCTVCVYPCVCIPMLLVCNPIS